MSSCGQLTRDERTFFNQPHEMRDYMELLNIIVNETWSVALWEERGVVSKVLRNVSGPDLRGTE
jgi:hypothetical protein